jgi:hypothetical protein
MFEFLPMAIPITASAIHPVPAIPSGHEICHIAIRTHDIHISGDSGLRVWTPPQQVNGPIGKFPDRDKCAAVFRRDAIGQHDVGLPDLARQSPDNSKSLGDNQYLLDKSSGFFGPTQHLVNLVSMLKIEHRRHRREMLFQLTHVSGSIWLLPVLIHEIQIVIYGFAGQPRAQPESIFKRYITKDFIPAGAIYQYHFSHNNNVHLFMALPVLVVSSPSMTKPHFSYHAFAARSLGHFANMEIAPGTRFNISSMALPAPGRVLMISLMVSWPSRRKCQWQNPPSIKSNSPRFALSCNISKIIAQPTHRRIGHNTRSNSTQ